MHIIKLNIYLYLFIFLLLYVNNLRVFKVFLLLFYFFARNIYSRCLIVFRHNSYTHCSFFLWSYP